MPQILRAAGVDLGTLAEHYGVPADEKVADVTWLELAGRNRWPVLMADSAVATNPAEIATVHSVAVQCFSVSNAKIPAYQSAGWILSNLPEMATLAAVPGPFVYAIEQAGLKRLA